MHTHTFTYSHISIHLITVVFNLCVKWSFEQGVSLQVTLLTLQVRHLFPITVFNNFILVLVAPPADRHPAAPTVMCLQEITCSMSLWAGGRTDLMDSNRCVGVHHGVNNLLLCIINNHFLLLSQLMQILSMGFQNKFYNASKKDPNQTSGTSVAEYRVNVSSDTPHWYIRDYLARISRHYDIRAIEVDGIYNLDMGVCQFSIVNKYCC